MLYKNREEAGKLLGMRVKKEAPVDPVVFGLARGGVLVAEEVSKALRAPLEALVVRKLGVPIQPE